MKHPFWLAALAGVVSALLASSGTTESLWVDELHSSWTISAGWNSVWERASRGNQLPLFFWLLFAVDRTLGFFHAFHLSLPAEFVLRFPSIVAWGGCVALAVGYAAQLPRTTAWKAAAPLCLLVWLNVDRIQLFYATEARPYEAVQLLSLIGWCCLGHVLLRAPSEVTRSDGQRDSPLWIWMWAAAVCLMLQLHVMSALSASIQFAVVAGIAWRLPSLRRTCWIALSLGGFSLCFALALSRAAWQQRQQWESFAGSADLQSLLHLFPLLAYLVPVVVARVVDAALAHRRRDSNAAQGGSSLWSWMWLLAATGPWLLAWLVTALELAPIFHRRYVIVAALPLCLLAAAELARVRLPGLRLAAGLGVALWLVISQGSLQVWRAGQWPGWQRVEGWREAARWIEQDFHSGDQLWCHSGLIEAHRFSEPLDLSEPLDAKWDNYLSFPLRGSYRVHNAAGQAIQPHALIGEPARWLAQIEARSHGEGGGGRVWIVRRRDERSLRRDLGDLSPTLRIQQIRGFGRVSAALVDGI